METSTAYLESVKKQFLYYKMLAEKSFEQLEDEQLFVALNENTNSIGLGLEICSKICELYHFKISYDFKDSKHFFTIYF